MTYTYVLTGGPDTGKSTLLNDLWGPGMGSIGDAAAFVRNKITYEKQDHSSWKNIDEFQKRVLRVQQEWEQDVHGNDHLFVLQDKGIPDGLAFYKIAGILPCEELVEAARRTNYTGVFLVEPLKRLEHSKTLRTHREQQDLHEAIKEVYAELGYTLISIPPIDRFHRAKVVLNHILENPLKPKCGATRNNYIGAGPCKVYERRTNTSQYRFPTQRNQGLSCA